MGHLAVILTLGAGGCQGRDIVPGVSDSTFVQTMAALRRVASDSMLGDSARAHRRDSVLRQHGVTAPQLERAARALADDPDRAESLFQAVNRANGATDSARVRPPGARRRPLR